MSTPNTSNPSQPSSASKKHGGHVSTPSRQNVNPSPAPRSVPSPAATRKDQAGKTPVNHPTTGSQSSKTVGGTPMVHNLSQTSNNAPGASPGIATGGSATGGGILSFGTPMGLGVDGITPLHQQGGAAMMPTMSDLGLTLSGGLKRNEDEERKGKLRQILQRIGRDTHMGRVSEEGIARVARRVGFANDIDAETLTAEERERKVGNRAISIAGNGIVVDVDLKKSEVREVQVLFDSTNTALAEKRAPEVSQVLLKDLQRGKRNPESQDLGKGMGPRLDRFARNMERLARVDRLSLRSVNCFEALSGIYGSLLRLYEVEKKAEGTKSEWDVMRHKSGRPKINTGGRIGFWLEYWQEEGPLAAEKAKADEDTDMADANEDSTMEDSKDDNEEAPHDSGIFSLHIEVESSLPGLYTPIRLSDKWLPDPLELPSKENEQQGIPWESPSPTFVPGSNSNSGPDAMAVDVNSSEQKLPELRFIARLDPPVVLPYNQAVAVHAAVGLPPPNIFPTNPHYQTLLLNPAAAQGTPVANQTVLQGERTVATFVEGEETEARHRYVAEVAKPEFGVRVEELPFEHPRQLIELLPVLRQWAAFGSLLKNSLHPNKAEIDSSKENGNVTDQTSRPTQIFLADLLTPPDTPASFADAFDRSLPVNIALATSPLPTLGIEIPSISGGVETIGLRIGANAEVSVTRSQTISEDATDEDKTKTTKDKHSSKKLAAALEICGGNLGVWIEWLRRQT